MKLSKGTANLMLAMGVFMLFVWFTRLYTFFAIDLQQSEGYLPFVHFGLVVVSLAIGFYLSYLGIKGRSALRRE